MALTLSALHVYPVKGLKGIDLEDARCTERGLENDRRWMVVDAEGEFLSQRSYPKMATVWTDLADGALTLSAPDVASVDALYRAMEGLQPGATLELTLLRGTEERTVTLTLAAPTEG